MARTTGWQAQTKWLTDQHYVSDKHGIWEDKVTRRDRECTVTDSDYRKVRGRSDCSGNFKPRTAWERAKLAVESLMRTMPATQVGAITPRMKWELVDLLAAGRGKEALNLLAFVQ